MQLLNGRNLRNVVGEKRPPRPRGRFRVTDESIETPEVETGRGLSSQDGELVAQREDLDGQRRPRTDSRPKSGQQGDEKRNQREPYQQTKPPSTSRSIPVQNDEARLARKTAGPTISSTVAIRPIGVSRSKILRCSATSGRRFIGVRV
jgi:hypothetical protein